MVCDLQKTKGALLSQRALVFIPLQRKAAGQQFRERLQLIPLGCDHVDLEIIPAEFPHHLTAHAAGRKQSGDFSILAAADGDGIEIPLSVVDRLKKRGALGAVCRAI